MATLYTDATRTGQALAFLASLLKSPATVIPGALTGVRARATPSPPRSLPRHTRLWLRVRVRPAARARSRRTRTLRARTVSSAPL